MRKRLKKLLREVSKFLVRDRGIFLNLDHSLEHGTMNFNERTINPEYIFNIAKECRFNALIMQKGLAMHYRDHYRHHIPLVLKLNGIFTSGYLGKHHLFLCSAEKAAKIGADAVGYTIKFGGVSEKEMIKEFSVVEEEAHEHGMPVFAFALCEENAEREAIAYAVRSCLELGADFVGVNYNNDPEDFRWIAKSAGNSKLFLSHEKRNDPRHIINEAYEFIRAGGKGLCLGSNFWNYERPADLMNALRAVVFGNRNVESALKFLDGDKK